MGIVDMADGVDGGDGVCRGDMTSPLFVLHAF